MPRPPRSPEIAAAAPGLSLVELQNCLDIHGADRNRWPADVARRLAALKGAEAEAATAALREAQALEAVLARASAVSPARQAALADRIMAQVQRDSTIAPASNVVAFARPVSVRPPPPRASTGSPVLAPVQVLVERQIGPWRVAAALAAALVLGIGVGVSGSATNTIHSVAETVGVSLDRSVLAFNDEIDDEDVL
jgi:hypothetical protein